MKKLSIRPLALTIAIVLAGLASSSHVFADPSFSIRIGSQGPPRAHRDYDRWEQPDPSAVWIPGHNEWRDGQYVWIGGYYGYPPHKGARWVQPQYAHRSDGNYYNTGHWSN